RLARQSEVRFAEGLGLSGVGVDQRGDILGECLPVVDELRLTDQLADAVPDHVQPDDWAVGSLDELHGTGGLEDLALAVARQVVGEGGDVGTVLLLRLDLGQAHGRHLGVGVRDPRDAGFVDGGRVESRDVLGDEDTLLETTVCQLQARHDVADGVDVRKVGAQALVGQHETAFHADARLVVAVTRGVRASTYGDQQHVGLEGFTGLQRHGDAVLVLLRAGELHTRLESDLAPTERPLKLLGGELVLRRYQSGQRFYDGDLGTEGGPDTGELDADHAAAQHDGLLGYEVEGQRVLAGDDAPAEFQTGDRLRVRTGGEHEVLPGVAGAFHVDGGAADEGPGALHVVDLVGLRESLQSLVQPRDHRILVLVDTGDVDAVEHGLDAELFAVPRRVGDLGGVEQRLGRNAASMQAGAAQLVLLDQSDG